MADRVRYMQTLESVSGQVLIAKTGAPWEVRLRGSATPVTFYTADTGGSGFNGTVANLATRNGRVEPQSTPGGELWIESGTKYDEYTTANGQAVSGSNPLVKVGAGGALSPTVERSVGLNVTDASFSGGARGDGTAEPVAPFQAAYNVAAALGGGRYVYVPAGTYYISDGTSACLFKLAPDNARTGPPVRVVCDPGVTLKFSTLTPRMTDFNKLDNFDWFRNVEFIGYGATLDFNNIGGIQHAIIGTLRAGVNQQYINYERIAYRGFRVINLYTDSGDGSTNLRHAVWLSPLGDASTDTYGNFIEFEDIDIAGGHGGITIGNAGAGSKFHWDRVYIRRCRHDRGLVSETFAAADGFYIGSRGVGGEGGIEGCYSRGAPDTAYEINGAAEGKLTNCLAVDPMNAGFLHRGANGGIDPADPGAKTVYEDCVTRKVERTGTMRHIKLGIDTAGDYDYGTVELRGGGCVVERTDNAELSVLVASSPNNYRAVLLNNVDLVIKANAASGKAVTGVAATDIFTSTAHGYALNQPVSFSGLTGGAGITAGTVYYVIASNLTANTFQVSTTPGGAALDFTTDLTAGTVTAASANGTGSALVTSPVYLDRGNGGLFRIRGLRIKLEGSVGVGAGLSRRGIDARGTWRLDGDGIDIDDSQTFTGGTPTLRGIGTGLAANASGAKSAIWGRLRNVRVTCTVTGSTAIEHGAFATQTQAVAGRVLDVDGLDCSEMAASAVPVSTSGANLKEIRARNVIPRGTFAFPSLASAATLNLPAYDVEGAHITVTGTTGVTAITASASGRVVNLQVTGACTFTDNGTTLDLAGDFIGPGILTVECDASGNWIEKSRVWVEPVSTVATDAAFTLTPGSSRTQTVHTGTLTANRAVTLSTTGAVSGSRFRITRTGGGAFTLDVGTGPLKSLATNTWGEFTYDGSAWKLAAYGAL